MQCVWNTDEAAGYPRIWCQRGATRIYDGLNLRLETSDKSLKESHACTRPTPSVGCLRRIQTYALHASVSVADILTNQNVMGEGLVVFRSAQIFPNLIVNKIQIKWKLKCLEEKARPLLHFPTIYRHFNGLLGTGSWLFVISSEIMTVLKYMSPLIEINLEISFVFTNSLLNVQ